MVNSRLQERDPYAPQLGLSFDPPRRADAKRRVWPVRELVGEVRELVELEYADVWVEGEISNLRPAPSGHVYFTLKDAEAQLPVVLFRRHAMLLRFRPEDGLRVLARGRVSVYEQRGQMQLVAETMEPAGAGSLQLAFEQLKAKLKDEGLFEQDRKRPLPSFPRVVGVITSPTGSVIRDFLNIVGRRHSGLHVMVAPVSVQGAQSASEVETALALLNTTQPDGARLVDLIVLARGGGSLEDLAAFNSERVARAIAASVLPVVSAIGHETDFTIADFVADLRAPTPSAAAELITEAQHKVAEHLAQLEHRLDRGARFQLLKIRQRFARLPLARAEARVTTTLHRYQQRLDELTFRLESAMSGRLRQTRHTVETLAASALRHDPRQQMNRMGAQLAALAARLHRTVERAMQQSQAQARNLDARLQALSPLAVLDRGYALVLDTDGGLVRSVAQVAPAQRLVTRLSDGVFLSRVESGGPNPEPTT